MLKLNELMVIVNISLGTRTIGRHSNKDHGFKDVMMMMMMMMMMMIVIIIIIIIIIINACIQLKLFRALRSSPHTFTNWQLTNQNIQFISISLYIHLKKLVKESFKAEMDKLRNFFSQEWFFPHTDYLYIFPSLDKKKSQRSLLISCNRPMHLMTVRAARTSVELSSTRDSLLYYYDSHHRTLWLSGGVHDVQARDRYFDLRLSWIMLRRCAPRQGTLPTRALSRPRSKWALGGTVKACVFE